jgi:hypothetical protein
LVLARFKDVFFSQTIYWIERNWFVKRTLGDLDNILNTVGGKNDGHDRLHIAKMACIPIFRCFTSVAGLDIF